MVRLALARTTLVILPVTLSLLFTVKFMLVKLSVGELPILLFITVMRCFLFPTCLIHVHPLLGSSLVPNLLIFVL